jgi:3-deoxy-D-manno-octulosonate 8-phosphate phosphatase (KDO 8-P phosphatase)
MDYPDDLLARAARIRLACFDVDGTLTDGGLYYDATGAESKRFHVHDGLGLRLLGEHGIAVALVTARRGEVVAARARDLRIAHVHVDVRDKAACVRELAASLGLAAEAVAHMGDDLPDLPALLQAGFAVAPANAHPWVAERVHWRTRARGGDGAVRELCDLLLVAQGRRDAVLAAHGAA